MINIVNYIDEREEDEYIKIEMIIITISMISMTMIEK